MEVKVVAQICPKCGGTLQTQDGQKKVFCKYCGTGLMLDDGTREYHIVDVAEINNVRLDSKIQQHNEEQLAKRHKQHAALSRSKQTWICLIVLFHILIGGGMVFISNFGYLPYIVEIWAFLGLVGPFVLALTKPDHIGSSRLRYIFLFYFTFMASIFICDNAEKIITKILSK